MRPIAKDVTGRSVVGVRVILCWEHRRALQKRIDRSRCRLGCQTRVRPSGYLLDEDAHWR